MYELKERLEAIANSSGLLYGERTTVENMLNGLNLRNPPKNLLVIYHNYKGYLSNLSMQSFGGAPNPFLEEVMDDIYCQLCLIEHS